MPLGSTPGNQLPARFASFFAVELYARVNILDGHAVRLPKGQISDAITLDEDPKGRTRSWLDRGADRVHVVDLDAAALGDPKNRGLIDEIIDDLGDRVQIAGGIRSHVEAARLIERGAWRIVMGTAAIEDQIMVWDLCRQYPEQVVVSLDVRPNEEIATRGWTRNSGRFLEEVLIEMSSAGAAAFLVSEAGRDALSEPPNMVILAEALGAVEDPIIAAGGVRNLDDLRDLMALTVGGRRLDGVIFGREVTEKRFTIEEAKEVMATADVEIQGEESASAEVIPLHSTRSLETEIYERVAEAAEAASAHARQAARLYAAGDPEAGAASGAAVEQSLKRAVETLDEKPDPVRP